MYVLKTNALKVNIPGRKERSIKKKKDNLVWARTRERERERERENFKWRTEGEIKSYQEARAMEQSKIISFRYGNTIGRLKILVRFKQWNLFGIGRSEKRYSSASIDYTNYSLSRSL